MSTGTAEHPLTLPGQAYERSPVPDEESPRDAQRSWSFPGPASADAPLGQLGDFDILAALGDDGFASMFRARERGLRRTVVLNVVNPATACRADLMAKVERASRAASVRHDHVVTVYRLEKPAAFMPYQVMEHIDGETLQEKLRRDQKMTPTAAASLGRQIALGLASLEGRGVNHGELTPANVLLDALTGRAKVRNFGLPRELDDAVFAEAAAELVGAAPYLSPEHFRGPAAVDGRSDIFSLGIVLYRMLTGQLPFRGTPLEIRAAVLSEEPARPRRLDKAIPTELETIVLGCLEKAPERRYATAQAVAEDLQRFLNGEPIMRRPSGLVQRSAGWVRRQPASAALAGMISLALAALAAGAVGLWFDARARKAADELAAARAELHARGASLRQINYLADIALAHEAWQNDQHGTLTRLLTVQNDPALQGFEWNYLRWLASRDGRRIGPKDPVTAAAFDQSGQLIAVGVVLGKDKTAQVQIWKVPTADKPAGELVYSLDGHPHLIAALLFHPKKDLLISADEEGQIRFWDLKTGKIVRTLEGSAPVAMNSSGQLLAFLREDGRIQRWSLTSEREVGGPIAPRDLSIAIEMAKGTTDFGKGKGKGMGKTPSPFDFLKGFVKPKIGDAAPPKQKSGPASKDEYEGDAGFEQMAFSPDGQRFVAVGGHARESGFALLWDLKKGESRKLEDATPRDLLASVVFSPDGQTIAAVGFDHSLRVWDAGTGRLRFRRAAHQLEVLTVAFNTAGDRIATAGADRIIRIWNARSGEEVRSFRGAHGIIRQLAFCPKPTASMPDCLLALNDQGELRWWNADEDQASQVLHHASPVVSLAFSADGQFLASVTKDSHVLVQGLVSKDRRHELAGDSNVARGLFNQDARSLLTLGNDGAARVWHFEKSKSLVYQPKGDAPKEKIWLADQRVIVRRDKEFWFSRRFPSVEQSLERLTSFGAAPDWEPAAVAVDRAGERFAMASNTDGIILRQRVIGGTDTVDKLLRASHVKNANQPAAKVNALAFSPSGRLLAVAGSDGSVQLWDTQLGELKHRLSGHLASVTCITFSSDGKRLVSGSDDWTVKVWDADLGRPILTLTEHKGRIRDLAFRPDGSLLATASEDGTVRLWPAAEAFLDLQQRAQPGTASASDVPHPKTPN